MIHSNGYVEYCSAIAPNVELSRALSDLLLNLCLFRTQKMQKILFSQATGGYRVRGTDPILHPL